MNKCSNIWYGHCFGLLSDIPMFSVFGYNHCDKPGGWRRWPLPSRNTKGHFQCVWGPWAIRAGVDGLRRDLNMWLGRILPLSGHPHSDVVDDKGQNIQLDWLPNIWAQKSSRRVIQIKEKLTADSFHAYYVHPDCHSDVDIMCILNPQIPSSLCQMSDAILIHESCFELSICWHMPMYKREKERKKTHTKTMNYFTSFSVVLLFCHPDRG